MPTGADAPAAADVDPGPVIGLCSAAIGLGAGPGFLFGFVGPALQDELGISRSSLGLLIGLFFGATGLASLLAARWGARLGARRCLIGNMLVITVTSAAVALWAGYAVLATAAVAGGVAYAFGNVGTNLAVTAVARPGTGGLALTIKTAGVPVVASLLALGSGLTVGAGWRVLPWTLAGCALVTTIAVATLLPHTHGRTARPAPEPALRHGFWVLPVAAFLFICGSQPLQSWLVTYLHDDAGMPVTRAGPLVAAGTAVAIVGMLVTAWFADRLGRRWRALLVALICLSAAVGIAAILVGAAAWIMVTAVGATLGLSANLAGAGLTHAVVVDRAPASVGRASGVTMTGYYLGALVAPWVFGLVADLTGGYVVSWTLSAVLLVLAAGAYLRAHLSLPVSDLPLVGLPGAGRPVVEIPVAEP